MRIDEGIKKLVELARKRGYVTYDDINNAFPDGSFSPEELDEAYVKLRSLVEIVDSHFPEPCPRF
jgi:RNA polymerase primary sigma factor